MKCLRMSIKISKHAGLKSQTRMTSFCLSCECISQYVPLLQVHSFVHKKVFFKTCLSHWLPEMKVNILLIIFYFTLTKYVGYTIIHKICGVHHHSQNMWGTPSFTNEASDLQIIMNWYFYVGTNNLGRCRSFNNKFFISVNFIEAWK